MHGTWSVSLFLSLIFYGIIACLLSSVLPVGRLPFTLSQVCFALESVCFMSMKRVCGGHTVQQHIHLFVFRLIDVYASSSSCVEGDTCSTTIPLPLTYPDSPHAAITRCPS